MKRSWSIALVTTVLCAASVFAGTRDALEQTFDKNKGSLYALYSRALRENPKLAGKIVFEIRIGTDGVVTGCRMVSSELNSPDLEQKLTERIKLIRFPPSESPVTIRKPIDFFPAG